MSPEDYPKSVGKDRVLQAGARLIVLSDVEMADWQVRKYRRPAIIVGGVKYFVAARERAGSGRTRYVLEPWPEDFRDAPGSVVLYDEGYVRGRDAAIRERKRLVWRQLALLPLTPLIGFLPSGAKRRIEDVSGISARSATLYSIWIELFLFFAMGVALWVLLYAGLRTVAFLGLFNPGPLLAYIGAVLLILVDVVFRYGSYLKEDRSPLGFCEWLIPRRRS